VWRHLPLTDVHVHARLAAEAAEAAPGQGAFWEMHDLLFDHQDALNDDDLIGYADQLELDVERFASDLRKRSRRPARCRRRRRWRPQWRQRNTVLLHQRASPLRRLTTSTRCHRPYAPPAREPYSLRPDPDQGT